MCNRFVLIFLSGCVNLVTAQTCPRPLAGSVVSAPVDLRSTSGRLAVPLSFEGELARYCYVYDGNAQAPTLRLHPGDTLILTLKNDLTPAERGSLPHHNSRTTDCGAKPMTAASTNLHFHGLNIPPSCHQDEVIHTSIQPGGPAFEYRVKIPASQPPGLYWYHPHPHGFSEAQVLGGASGALIVEGIDREKPQTAGVFERLLVLRDQILPGMEDASEDAGPARDLTVNYVPILYPMNRPAVISAQPGRREFWRVLNAAADTYFDLQVRAGPD